MNAKTARFPDRLMKLFLRDIAADASLAAQGNG
jgi:hypothetical protein